MSSDRAEGKEAEGKEAESKGAEGKEPAGGPEPQVGRDGERRDGAGHDGERRDGAGRDGAGRDGAGRDGAAYRTSRARPGDLPWLTRVILVAALVVIALAGLAIAASRLPLWWSRRVSALADGTYSAGVFAGLACGIAFTLLPLLVWRGLLRRHVPWRGRVWLLAVGLVLALPNLMTLGIVVGTDANASAARRAAGSGAPGFRGASLAGALIGVVLAVTLWVLLAARRRSRRRIAELESELRRRVSVEGGERADGDSDRRDPFRGDG